MPSAAQASTFAARSQMKLESPHPAALKMHRDPDAGPTPIMRDFIRFIRNLFEIVYFIRGIILTFALLLLICVVVISLAEGLPFGRATYFVLITALTIGYGDVTPMTPLGRITSVAAGIFGLLVTGIVVAVAVRALTQSVQQKINEDESGD